MSDHPKRPYSAILGLGEVGKSLRDVLSRAHTVFGKDRDGEDFPDGPVGAMHVCLNYIAMGRSAWLETVLAHMDRLKPRVVDVCSTVPPGTTEALGRIACHSTTRGLHPNLRDGLLKIPKHIGGPMSGLLSDYYRAAGVPTVIHGKASTTEAAHIAHLLDYGLQIVSADMRNQFCRLAGADYMEAVVKYTETHNRGFKALDMPSKVRMNLTPPNGKVGGHCVIEAAKLANEAGFQHPLVDYLACFNG